MQEDWTPQPKNTRSSLSLSGLNKESSRWNPKEKDHIFERSFVLDPEEPWRGENQGRGRGRGKQVLAAADDTEGLNPSVSAISASPPSHPPEQPSVRDDSYLAAPLVSRSRSTSPGTSSIRGPGSPGRQRRQLSSTPNPPALPALPKYRGAWDSLSSSSPEYRRAESSAYYTTAWGSPYATPSPRRPSWSVSQYAGRGRESGDTSPVSMRSGLHQVSGANNTDFLRHPSASSQLPRRVYNSLGRLAGRDPVGRQGGRSIRDFTEDWINQYLSGQPRTERTNWLSDDSGSEAPSFFTARNHFTEDASDGWLGLDDDSRDEDLLKTPTVANFVGRKARSGDSEVGLVPPRPKHISHKSTDTLKQEHFWGFAYDKDPAPSRMSDHQDAQPSVEADSNKPLSPVEKPLPPPPPMDTPDVDTSTPKPSSEDSSPKKATRPALIGSSSSSQRPKKRVIWRGKACIIAMPLEDKRGSQETGHRLLTPADVEARLKKFQDEGYDIRGFSVCTPGNPFAASEEGGLSRPSHPDPAESQQEWKSGRYSVSFPDQSVWNAYVNFLNEEKLRALGVSLGDDEPQPTISPASVPLSHVSGPYPGLMASPPIPTSSAASNQFLAGHPFSPHFNHSTNTSTNVGSLASPASQFGPQPGFFGADQNLPAGFPFQFTPPIQGSFTPQSFLSGRQAGASSTVPGSLPNLSSILSPVSPLNAEDSNAFHPGLNDIFPPQTDSILDQFGHDTHGETQGRSSRPVHTPSDKNAEPETFQTSNLEIAHPTPRGHGHNVSETLQKGLDRYAQADYHLEESIQRQLEEDDRESSQQHQFAGSDLLTSRWALPEQDSQSSQKVSQPQKQGSLSQQHRLFGEQYPEGSGRDASDIDTNPSVSGTPRGQEPAADHASWHKAKKSTSSFVPGHKSRTSMSAFNVEAKEFDPTGSFSSNNFHFQGNSFQPSGFDSAGIFSPNSTFKPPSSTGSFNVAAPSFSPFNQQSSFSPSGFQFSSASFNVEAPVFNPGSSVNSATGSEVPGGGKTKIFGDVDFSEISKPAKRSKAIPIVRPDDIERGNKEKSAEEAGSAGPTGRQKRVRRGGEDGDKDAELATPLAEAVQTQSPQVPSTSHTPAEGKENAVPGKEDETTPDAKVVAVSSDDKPAESKETPISEAETWAPFEFKNETEAAEFNAATPEAPDQFSIQKQESKEPTEAKEEQPPTPAKSEPVAPKETVPEPSTEYSVNDAKRPAPPAKVKHFEFRPSIAEFIPSTAALTESAPEPPSKKKPAGLMASRYAVISPPASPKVEATTPETTEPEKAVDMEPTPEETAPPAQQMAPISEEHDSLDEQELDAVMKQLNGDDSDVGVERLNTPRPPEKTAESPVEQAPEPHLPPTNIIRSVGPSPSPRRLRESILHNVPKLGSDLDTRSQITFSARGLASHTHSPVRQLLSANEQISDWDDVISSGEDEKLVNRSRFFDTRVNDIVGNALEGRLNPLERTLSVIQQSVASLASRSASRRPLRSASAEIEHSDADDEDDENAPLRSRSPLNVRDRKLDKLKNAILEALVAHQSSHPEPVAAPAVDFAPLQESIAELKALATSREPQYQTTDLKQTIQEVISEQLNHRDSWKSDAEEIGAESLKLQVDGLKSMLRIADERADQQYRAYRESQDALAEVQRLLKFAEEDAARHRDAAQVAEEGLRDFKEHKLPHFEKIQKRSNALQEQHESLQLTLSELSAKNIALEGTLDEYRLSSDQWRHEIDEVKAENKELRATINHLKLRIEDSMRARQSLRGKFDRLQDDMTTATRDIARDQASWRKREEEQNAKYNALRASFDREAKLREKLEIDISELEQQEREAAKLKFIFAQSQQENARLEELVANLRAENHELQGTAARFEREFNEARESSRAEVQRTRTSLESDVEAANNQVNYVRAELESQVSRLQSELENVRMDADTTKERYELLLEEAKDAKAAALAAAAEFKENTVEEQRKLHERVLNDLRERHARALHNASEDRQRSDAHLLEKLALSDEKVEHLKDRVVHLEEKLEIAKSAARAAAQAAQSAKGAPNGAPSHHTSPSMSFRRDSVPEKISPQALRESILVLQDQLQQREGRIEELEQELSAVDKDAPNKIKDRDTEINWLRELLGVRIDDLQDIINTLSQPSFNENAVRDAAIRLKANLQMEQQEKERMAGGQTFPSLSSISNLAASPRSLPLAAAAAWGNWRKARDTSVAANLSEQTPSKSSNSGSFLSGLLTPPSSNVRQSPANASAPPSMMSMGGRRSYSESRPLRAYNNKTPRSASARQMDNSPPHQEPPTTPPLLRRSSYDHDAEPNSYDNSAFGDDLESTVGGLVSESPRAVDGPFGPQIS